VYSPKKEKDTLLGKMALQGNNPRPKDGKEDLIRGEGFPKRRV